MKILALCSYPIESAATRFRIQQFILPLRKRGIDLELSPFISAELFSELYKGSISAKKVAGMANSVISRLVKTFKVRNYDALFIQREAMLFGPEIFERLYKLVGRIPMVLDLDDATYLPYKSPTNSKIASALKFFGKTNRLIEQADIVVCGNPNILDYVRSKGTPAVEIPTVVDSTLFSPIFKNNVVPAVGWIGTHSTFRFLERLFPTIQRLAMKHNFTLRIVGSGKDEIAIDGVNVENIAWSLDREISDFQSLDLGLYPIFPDEVVALDWILGKSGFKAIQYLTTGIPFVMSPVGVCASIGIESETHLNAQSLEEWYGCMDRLLSDSSLRATLGRNGRDYAISNYSLIDQVSKLEMVLRTAVSG